MRNIFKAMLMLILFLSLIGVVSAGEVNSTDFNSSFDKLDAVDIENHEIPQENLSEASTDSFESDNSSQIVKSMPVISIKSAKVKSKDTLAVYLKDKAGNPLKFQKLTAKINKRTIHLKTNSKGIADLKISLPANTYKLTISFDGNKDYNLKSKSFNIKVSKLSCKIIRFTNFVLNGHYFYAYLNDARGDAVAGKKIILKLNGKTYTRTTNKNGRVAIKVTSPYYTKYAIRYRFDGDGLYAPCTKKVSFYVNHYTSIRIENSKLLTNGYLRVCLKDSSISVSGKTIRITVGSKTFHKKTNYMGTVIFKPKMPAKKYKITVRYGQYYVSKVVNCIRGNVKDPLNESIPLRNGLPDIDVMPGNYVWADESATYTLTRAQYREVMVRDSCCLYLYNKLPKYTFFKTKDHPNTYHIVKREKWNVIEKAVNARLVSANRHGYWPSSITVSLRGKSYKYPEVRDTQDTLYTCGPTACSMCSQVLKNYLCENYIAKHSGTTKKDGTACSGMIKTLEMNKFNCTYYYRNTFDYALQELAKGGCALVFHAKNHYVALLDISRDGKKVLVSNSLGTYDDIPSKWVSVGYMKTRYYKNYDDGLIVRLNYNLSKSAINRISSYYHSMAPNWYGHSDNEIVS